MNSHIIIQDACTGKVLVSKLDKGIAVEDYFDSLCEKHGLSAGDSEYMVFNGKIQYV
jgi:hypothetical protein